jgi:hypothetical protein
MIGVILRPQNERLRDAEMAPSDPEAYILPQVTLMHQNDQKTTRMSPRHRNGPMVLQSAGVSQVTSTDRSDLELPKCPK